jgi:hypothetical protein
MDMKTKKPYLLLSTIERYKYHTLRSRKHFVLHRKAMLATLHRKSLLLVGLAMY